MGGYDEDDGEGNGDEDDDTVDENEPGFNPELRTRNLQHTGLTLKRKTSLYCNVWATK